MGLADRILAEVVDRLGPHPSGVGYRFVESPAFLKKRIDAAADVATKRAVIKRLAVFGYYLAEEKASAEASAALMRVLDDYAQGMKP